MFAPPMRSSGTVSRNTRSRAGTFAATSVPMAWKSECGGATTCEMSSVIPDCFDHVFEFVAAVGGVDVDEDGAHLRGRVLDEGPFGNVLRPDPDSVALLHAAFEQSDGQCIGVGVELRVRPPPVRFPVDECQGIGVRSSRCV
jgi:hypothetical protein